MRNARDRQSLQSRLLQRLALGFLLALAVLIGASTWLGAPAPAVSPSGPASTLEPRGSWVEAWIRSAAVPGARVVLAYLPPSYREVPVRSYPTVFFLHGGPGAALDWMVKGRIAAILDGLERAGRIPECIAILPDATGPARLGRSLYVNSYDGRSRMEDFLTGDLVRWVDRRFRTRDDPADRLLVGVSDGGGAAVNLGLRHPDRFGGCAGLSGEYLLPSGPDLAPVLGSAAMAARIRGANSPLIYLAGDSPRPRPPRIYFDCGWLDPAIWDGLDLDRRLGSLGIDHAFRAYMGSHGWSFWRGRLPLALAYLFERAADHPAPSARRAGHGPIWAGRASQGWRLPRRPEPANFRGSSARVGRDRGGP